MKALFLLCISVVFFIVSCQTNSRIEGIDELFKIEQFTNNGIVYYQTRFNDNYSKNNRYSTLVNENHFVFEYLNWNLIDLKLPDSIKRSSKTSFGEIEHDYKKFLLLDSDIQNSFSVLLDPKNVIKINVDSLIKITSKLFYAERYKENQMAWKVCAGLGITPQIYGVKNHLKTVILQAFCYQSIFEGEAANDVFDKNIPLITKRLLDEKRTDYIFFANNMMWNAIEIDDETKYELVNHISDKAQNIIEITHYPKKNSQKLK